MAIIKPLNGIVPKIGKDYNIYIDCGTEDFFYKVNLDLHNRLLDKKIPHVYIARPGKHDGAYWNNAIDYQLLYFSKILRPIKMRINSSPCNNPNLPSAAASSSSGSAEALQTTAGLAC